MAFMLRSLGRRRCEIQCPMIDPSASSTLRPVSELKPSSGSHANLSHRFAGSAEVRTCHRTGRAVLRHRPPTPQNAQVILSLSSGGIVQATLYRVEVRLTRSTQVKGSLKTWGHETQARADWCIGGASRTSQRPVDEVFEFLPLFEQKVCGGENVRLLSSSIDVVVGTEDAITLMGESKGLPSQRRLAGMVGWIHRPGGQGKLATE